MSCGNPGSIPHAMKIGNSYLYQDTVTYSCHSGYEVKSGHQTRTCGSGKQWSGSVPVCGGKYCDGPMLKTQMYLL